jgi:hypothetical protein
MANIKWKPKEKPQTPPPDMNTLLQMITDLQKRVDKLEKNQKV